MRCLHLFIALLPLTACVPTEVPGASLGLYEVQGALAATGCGEGFIAPETLAFRVELREQAPIGYWRINGEGAVLSGTADDAGAFRFVDVVQVPTLVDEITGNPTCTLEKEEIVTLQTVDPTAAGAAGDAGQGSADGGVTPAFTGTSETRLRAAGGDCSALLAVLGGPFPALPCSVSYELTGWR